LAQGVGFPPFERMGAGGNDDLDLDGNWAPSLADEGAEGPGQDKPKKRKKRPEEVAAATTQVKKRRKKQQEGAAVVEAEPTEAKKKKKKKLRTPTQPSLDDAAAPKVGKKKKKKPRAAVAESPLITQASKDGKKKKKTWRKHAAFDAYEESARTISLVGDEKSRTLMCRRLQAAWDVEASANKLSALEKQEVLPSGSWFVPCAEGVTVNNLLQRCQCSAGDPPLRTFLALRDGKKLPSPVPKSAALAVIVPSVDRVFAIVGEMREAQGWRKVKPVVLAAHGGGRKSDQVLRQAKALEQGTAVAVATPGRLLRLFEEGHAQPDGFELLVLDLTRDIKRRDLLKMPDTRKELFNLLRCHLMKPIQGERTRLVFCGA